MGDSLISVITFILAAILMFVFPMMTLADRTDDIAQLAVQTTTVQFVDEVRQTGKITASAYDDFIETLYATGNTYKIELELKRLDENPSKKAATNDLEEVVQNVYYTLYTTQIEEQIESGTLYLKQGDIFAVSVVNNSQTIAEVLKNAFYQVTGNSSYTVTGQHEGVVMVDGQYSIEYANDE